MPLVNGCVNCEWPVFFVENGGSIAIDCYRMLRFLECITYGTSLIRRRPIYTTRVRALTLERLRRRHSLQELSLCCCSSSQPHTSVVILIDRSICLFASDHTGPRRPSTGEENAIQWKKQQKNTGQDKLGPIYKILRSKIEKLNIVLHGIINIIIIILLDLVI